MQFVARNVTRVELDFTSVTVTVCTSIAWLQGPSDMAQKSVRNVTKGEL